MISLFFGVSDNSSSFEDNQAIWVGLPYQLPGGSYWLPVTVHGLFEVSSAGDHTFYFLGSEHIASGTDNWVQDIQFSLVYFPTAYGTVTSMSFGGQAQASTDDSAKRPGLIQQEIDQEKTEADIFNTARIQNELDALQRKIDSLRKLVE